MDGDREVDVPDLEPARQDFRNRTRVGEEQDGLVIGYHILHHPQSRSHFGMREQFPRESMILTSRLRRTDLKPHLTSDRYVNHLNWSPFSHKKLSNKNV